MSFTIKELSEEYKAYLKNTGGWNENCPIDISRLNIIEVLHLNLEREICNGSLLILDVAAESAINIFKELLAAEFPINSMILLDEYDYDDYKSMSANNSSCFNNRLILPRQEQYSIHAYGLAIDINPAENPMISHKVDSTNYSEFEIYPAKGKNFINRMLLRPGMVEPIVEIFFKNGFEVWGGLWNEPVDYHHFQTTREFAIQLSKLSKEEGQKLWNAHIDEIRD